MPETKQYVAKIKGVDWEPGVNAPETLQPNTNRQISFGIGPSGAVCVYGINSFRPVTLYGQQFIDLLAVADQVVQFIHDNKHELAWKAGPTTTRTGRTIAQRVDPVLAALRLAFPGKSDEDLQAIRDMSEAT
jgi:hypothetical protein